MTSVFVGKHLANDGFGDALNVFFGEMCTPRCDTCFMSILVSVSVVMAFFSMLVFFAAARECGQYQQSSESTVVFFYALLAFTVFALIVLCYGFIGPRLAS